MNLKVLYPTYQPHRGAIYGSVASYSSEEAKQHAERLKSSGLTDAFYIAAHVNGHVWYRVSVGLFATHKVQIVFRKQIVRKTSYLLP